MMETQRTTIPAAEEILNRYFPILDHGFVALVDYMGGDHEIARSARVSYGHGTKTPSEDEAVLRYMYRHGHTSPFEMTELKFHCSMPIFVARQWIRHRTANVNEVSGRYSVLPMQFYTPSEEQLRVQSKTNKQGRGEGVVLARPRDLQETWHRHRESVRAIYHDMLEADLARELARIDLPLSTYTQWYWKIDLHNLFHFLTLRVDSHAQWEIRQYANAMAAMVFRVAPLSAQAWLDYDVCGVKFSRAEMEILRGLLEVRSSLVNTEYVLPHIGGTVLSRQDNAKQSAREKAEFLNCFRGDQPAIPTFELDLAQAKSALYFEEMARQYTDEP